MIPRHSAKVCHFYKNVGQKIIFLLIRRTFTIIFPHFCKLRPRTYQIILSHFLRCVFLFLCNYSKHESYAGMLGMHYHHKNFTVYYVVTKTAEFHPPTRNSATMCVKKTIKRPSYNTSVKGTILPARTARVLHCKTE